MRILADENCDRLIVTMLREAITVTVH